MSDKKEIMHVPAEKFRFVNEGERLKDKRFEDKPIGYFKDAWIRFRKNKASVVATVIIVAIILYAIAAPLLINRDMKFMDSFYNRKAPRLEAAADADLGFLDGGMMRDFSDKSLLKAIAIGVAAEDWDAHGATIEEGMNSKYQPIISIGTVTERKKGKNVERSYTNCRIDAYLEVGFINKSIQRSEYEAIVEWEKKTGLHVLYPLLDEEAKNYEVTSEADAANCWYQSKKYAPILAGSKGKASDNFDPTDGSLVLMDCYLRDADGNPVYYQLTGGGTMETAQYKVRVLYYNYYIYQNGSAPDYILGTDVQGYDLALRIASGIRLSLLLAVCVSLINFVIGAIYGAVSGYYGGAVDLTMERITDILSGIPFIVVATLFQIHLSAQVGAIPSLLFAFVLTGWIGTAYRVRTQFYRFKNSEYVMAAHTLGARDRRIIWKHIFPNSLGTIITSSALVIPGVIFQESMLSFLGIVKLGSASSVSLGTLLSDASGEWTSYPHLLLYPAIVISLLMICFNLFGNGLRDAFNPSLRGVED